MTKRNLPQGGASSFASFFMSQPYLLLVLAPLFWAGNVTAGRLATGIIDPIVLSALRWTFAFLLILPFSLPALRREWPVIRRHWLLLTIYGGLGYSTFNVLIYIGTTLTTAVNASMEQAAVPMLVILGNFLVFGTRITLLQLAGVILTIYGVIHVATYGDPAAIFDLDLNAGDILIVAACVLYAAYSMLLRYRPAMSWMSFLCTTTAAGAVFSLVYQALFAGGPAVLVDTALNASAYAWALIAYVVIFPSILAQLFYARGLEIIGANRGSLFINLLPVFGAILGVLVVGETLELFHVVAALIIVAGIALAEFAARRHIPPAPPT